MIASYFEYLSKVLSIGYLSTYFIESMNLLEGFTGPFLQNMAEIARKISQDLSSYVEKWNKDLIEVFVDFKVLNVMKRSNIFFENLSKFIMEKTLTEYYATQSILCIFWNRLVGNETQVVKDIVKQNLCTFVDEHLDGFGDGIRKTLGVQNKKSKLPDKDLMKKNLEAYMDEIFE